VSAVTEAIGAILAIGVALAVPASDAQSTRCGLSGVFWISAQIGAVGCVRADAGAAVADGHGGWFLVTGHGFAHLRHDGRLDSHWHTQFDQDVLFFTKGGPRLFAYARPKRGRLSTPSLQAFDAATGKRLWTVTRIPARLDYPWGLLALSANSSVVYVGGDFGSVDGVPRDGLAALDARTGRVLPWRAPSPTVDPIPVVDAVAVVGSRLYIGGPFSTIGGKPRPAIAALRARDGALLPWEPGTAAGFAPGAGVGDVDTIFVSHGRVFTSGHDGFGVTDARSGRVYPWMYEIHGVARIFGGAGRIVYLGGDSRNSFDAVSGMSRHNLAAVDVLTGRFTKWGPNVAPEVGIAGIVPSGDRVLVFCECVKSLG
jgi:PQQ-like domain